MGQNERSFNIIADDTPLARLIIASLEARGFHYNPFATLAVVIDVPYGFALNVLETLSTNSLRVVVVTHNPCPEYLDDLWMLRPAILLRPTNLPQDLIEAMEMALQGQRHRSMYGTSMGLSSTQRRILRLLASGCTNQEIAERLSLQSQTIKNLLSLMYTKLGLKNRNEAILYYWGNWRAMNYTAPHPVRVECEATRQ